MAEIARSRLGIAAAIAVAVLVAMGAADAAKVSDIRGTKHNLSASGPGTVKATTETQVCVFCHTPHAASAGASPLWNRQLSNQTYTVYTSSSLDANAIQGSLDQPGGSSKLCLSCHDGTLALGNVNVLNGVGPSTIAMTGTTADGKMPDGSGPTTGFTRKLGVDLSNDHPISVSYTTALANRDGELRPVDAAQKWPPNTGETIGVRSVGYKPQLPLEPTGGSNTGQVQCGTCHDPHIRETDALKGNQKFLRQNRFQELQPTGGPTFDPANDIICLACHDKNTGAGTWAFSAHANQNVANETYVAGTPTTIREFPDNLPVWRAACMNCHDTHTVQGAKRLLREATDSLTSPKAGGNPALEQTCYQCHTTLAASAVTGATSTVPNIQTDFGLAFRMPITGNEAHDIGTGAAGFSEFGVDCSIGNPNNKCGADFIEPRLRLGNGALGNRHVECTDCHNPHRVIKAQNGIPGGLNATNTNEKAGTHRHEDAAGFTHTNLISGVLRGSWGVEPLYASASFFTMPGDFLVKRGDPGTNADTSVGALYVTREYQICLKCHSNYAYADDNVYPSSINRPQLGGAGLTPANPGGRINYTSYTNQAREFQAPVAHKGAPGALGTAAGAAAAYNNANNRSWHPVMDNTGRTLLVRGGTATAWRLPWATAVGSNTMYCSDCHGSATTGETAMPAGNTNTSEDGSPWGPHGSTNNFILKGIWDIATGSGQQATGLCFKCHTYANYADRSGGTGFVTDKGDGHQLHFEKIGRMRCNWCHVAVPHGWKNMALLVNLNDVGPEAGLTAGTQVRNNTTAAYSNGPYYRNAVNKVRNFRSSGTWVDADCGSAGAPGNGQSGRSWMRDSNENCTNAP